LICVGDAFDAFNQKPFCLSGLPWPDTDNPLSAATPRRRFDAATPPRRHAAGGEHRSLAITRDLSDQRLSRADSFLIQLCALSLDEYFGRISVRETSQTPPLFFKTFFVD